MQYRAKLSRRHGPHRSGRACRIVYDHGSSQLVSTSFRIKIDNVFRMPTFLLEDLWKSRGYVKIDAYPGSSRILGRLSSGSFLGLKSCWRMSTCTYQEPTNVSMDRLRSNLLNSCLVVGCVPTLFCRAVVPDARTFVHVQGSPTCSSSVRLEDPSPQPVPSTTLLDFARRSPTVSRRAGFLKG